jgi:hypothetical protein
MFPLANPFYVVVQQPFFSSQGDSKYGDYLWFYQAQNPSFQGFFMTSCGVSEGILDIGFYGQGIF